jgi:hypothetical protein
MINARIGNVYIEIPNNEKFIKIARELLKVIEDLMKVEKERLENLKNRKNL